MPVPKHKTNSTVDTAEQLRVDMTECLKTGLFNDRYAICTVATANPRQGGQHRRRRLLLQRLEQYRDPEHF